MERHTDMTLQRKKTVIKHNITYKCGFLAGNSSSDCCWGSFPAAMELFPRGVPSFFWVAMCLRFGQWTWRGIIFFLKNRLHGAVVFVNMSPKQQQVI